MVVAYHSTRSFAFFLSFSLSSSSSFSIRHWNDDRMLSSVGTGWWRSKKKKKKKKKKNKRERSAFHIKEDLCTDLLALANPLQKEQLSSECCCIPSCKYYKENKKHQKDDNDDDDDYQTRNIGQSGQKDTKLTIKSKKSVNI